MVAPQAPFVSQRKPQRPLRQNEGKRSVLCWRRRLSWCSMIGLQGARPRRLFRLLLSPVDARFLGLHLLRCVVRAALAGRSANTPGAGKLGTTSAPPSITLALAPASRCASIPLISSIDRSICIGHRFDAAMLEFQLFRNEHCADLQVTSRALPPKPLEHLAPMLLPILRQIEQKALVEGPPHSLRATVENPAAFGRARRGSSAPG